MNDSLNAVNQHNRMFFGQPIREDTTAECYPTKISVDEFCEAILNNKEAFAENMKKLCPNDERFVEEWFETFAAWSEIE
jgi:hypothetical protein